jgi:mono/diheme cytochrome c family protein
MLGTLSMHTQPMTTARRHAPRLSAACLALLLGAPVAWAQTRGELLYATHCVSCHTEQMHWRDKKQAVDWASLKAQVQLWQATGMLGWPDDDVQQVARYLNDTYYRFAAPPAPGTARIASRWPGAGNAAGLPPQQR